MDLYKQLTSTIDDIFKTQLSGSVDWRAVPGQMVKVSSSGAGYTWGLNAVNQIYYCVEPCSGAWKQKPISDSLKILDITTDIQNAYVLIFDGKKHVVYSTSADGSGQWSTPVQAPEDSTTIVATTNDVYVDSQRGAFKCKSPCSLPAWTPIVTQSLKLQGDWTRFPMVGPMDGKTKGKITTGDMKGKLGQKVIVSSDFNPNAFQVRLTSASSRYAYGVDTDNKAQMYFNGDWRTIKGLEKYDVASVSGEIDSTAIYAIDTDARLLRCEAPCESVDDVKEIGTRGAAPNPDDIKQVSINPHSLQVWNLSQTSGAGTGGFGIFNRLDGVPTNIQNTLNPLDHDRDNAIVDINATYGRALKATEIGREIDKTTKEVKNARPRTLPQEDPRLLRRSLDFETARKPILLLQIACGTVFGILLILFLLPSPFSTIVAFLIACIGGAVIISFSTS